MARSGWRGARGGGSGKTKRSGRHVMVVESPVKARTIGGYLGREYRVIATRGHVRDLPAKAGSVKPEDGFAMVTETGKRAARTLAAVAKALANAETLVLATDPDREGEAIAWQVLEWLTERGAVGDVPVHRIAFHEVTPAAVRTALSRPRDLDMDLVRAWQARRALDYLVGYGLSPILWRKLPGCRSAGRVQSVALRLLCDREAEIEAFVPRQYRTVHAELAAADGVPFPATLVRLDGMEIGEAGFATAGTAEDAAGRIGKSQLAVLSVERDALRRRPPAALDHLDPAAGGVPAARLRHRRDHGDRPAPLRGRRPRRRDRGAHHLHAHRFDGDGENGGGARAVARKRFGDAYVPTKPRVHRSRDRQGGTPRLVREAHEAIRPTDFARAPDRLAGRLDRAAVQLYGLIWNRALASQMAAARFDRVRVEIAPEGTETGGIGLAAGGSKMVFDGHLRVWCGDSGQDAEGDGSVLPALAEREPVECAQNN